MSNTPLCSSQELDDFTKEALQLLERLIAIPSVSREETEAADELERFMRSHGMGSHRSGNNLWVVSEGYHVDRPTILLNAHIDTVRPSADWAHPPFQPVYEDGRLYGLGSNDCGGGLVTLLQVFRILTRSEQSYNLVYLASCEEEVSGKGGIESVLPLLPPVSVAIVGEPTGMQPAIAEKGLMVLDVTAHGRAGHAARNEGINAIYEAMDDIVWFRTHRFERVSDWLGPVKMTVTIINAGTQHNVVPAECRFTVDIRVTDRYANEEVIDEIRRHVSCDVVPRSTRLKPSSIDPAHPIVQAGLALGRTTYGSPTTSDQALLDVPSLKLGVGDSARSHSADEFVYLSEIEEGIGLYIQMLERIL